jgi:CHRD domain
LKKKLIKKIIAKPENYYVNIHTVEYPDGAIRGQLELSAETETQ